MCLWAVLDDDPCNVLTVLDDTDPSCSPWDGFCGGCTSCLFAQADYSGCTIIPVPVDVDAHETFSDALANIMAAKPKPGRIPALQTCLDRQWGPGMALASKDWKAPRKLAGSVTFNQKLGKTVPMQSVRLVILNPDGTGLREEYLYTFPEDVHPLEQNHATTSPVA